MNYVYNHFFPKNNDYLVKEILNKVKGKEKQLSSLGKGNLVLNIEPSNDNIKKINYIFQNTIFEFKTELLDRSILINLSLPKHLKITKCIDIEELETISKNIYSHFKNKTDQAVQKIFDCIRINIQNDAFKDAITLPINCENSHQELKRLSVNHAIPMITNILKKKFSRILFRSKILFIYKKENHLIFPKGILDIKLKRKKGEIPDYEYELFNIFKPYFRKINHAVRVIYRVKRIKKNEEYIFFTNCDYASEGLKRLSLNYDILKIIEIVKNKLHLNIMYQVFSGGENSTHPPGFFKC